jgi:predicted transcriptional regulator
MQISKEKRDKISEQILSFLFFNSPKLFFTYDIAKEVARDEEFIKEILLELKNRGLVIQVTKNQEGNSYKRRIRWKLTDQAYDAYKTHL